MISLLSDRFPYLLIGIKVAKSGYSIVEGSREDGILELSGQF